MLAAAKRLREQQRLIRQDLDPTVVPVARRTEAKLDEAARGAIHQRFGPEFLGEALEFPCSSGALVEVHEMRANPPLGEEPKRGAGGGVLLGAEDLHLEGAGLGAHVRMPGEMVERAIYRGERPFRAAWWLANPHMQTLWGKFMRRRRLVETRAERWELPDGDFLDVERLESPAGAPHIVILHGLEGTAASHYVRSAFAEAAARGWGATLLIFRGCGRALNRARRLYHSGETSDLDFVVRRIAADAPGAPVVITGFSLGGNVTLKWLGEQGSAVPPEVVAAAAVSVPFDLARGSRFLERGFAAVYTKAFLTSLVEKAEAKVAQYPDLPVNLAAARTATTLWAFDDAMTAPLHGFRDAGHYYATSSSLGYLARVQRPALLLSAVDDPFVPPSVLDDVRGVARDNPFLTCEFSPRGGHVGFVGGACPWRPLYFAERHLVAWLADRIAERAAPSATRAAFAPHGPLPEMSR